ncbi:MAG: glycosyl hydrolase family 3, partial [Prochlorococcus sp.]
MKPLIQSPLRRQVAEIVVVRASGHASDQQRRYPQWELSNKELQRLLRDGVGGVILLGGTSTELAHRCQTLRHWAKAPIL